MKKLSQEEMLRFVDGTLDEQRALEVDEFSKIEDEDARLLLEMREAVGLLREWDEAEPVHASADFWPKLRDQLPASPPRNWWSRITAGAEQIAPRRSVWQLSMKAAVAAVVIALAATFFAPKNAQQNLTAAPLSPAAQQFIDQSVVRHRTYTAVQPPAIGVVPADGRAQDGDDDGEDDGDGSYTP